MNFAESTTNVFSLRGVNNCKGNVNSCLNRSVRLSVRRFVDFFWDTLKIISVKLA